MQKQHLTIMYILIFLFASLLPLSSIPLTQASAQEIYVDSAHHAKRDGTAEYPLETIAEAIERANPGDTIYVFGGLYREHLIINKKLLIVGSIERGDTIIDCQFDRRYTVEVTADYVTLEGLTFSDFENRKTSPIGALLYLKSDNVIVQRNNFTDSNTWGIFIDSTSEGNVISQNNFHYVKEGIYVLQSSTNDLMNNKITNCTENAIKLFSAVNNRLYNNTIANNSYGIYVKECRTTNITNNTFRDNNFNAVLFENSNTDIILANNFINNYGSGIYCNSANCKITKNRFERNRRGITLIHSGSTIRHNFIANSTATGIYATSISSNNMIYLNRFFNNAVSAQEFGNNLWYTEPQQGNYWSDYNEIDRNKDKIGDTFYTTNGVLDKYPLGYFLKWPLKPTNPAPEDFETNVGLDITLKVNVEDPDTDVLTAYFYRADDNTLIGTNTKAYSGEKVKYSFIQPFDTTFLWYVVVNDSKLENQSDIWIFTTRPAPPTNTPPVAEAGGPYATGINTPVIFDASASTDPDGKILYYRWNFGDQTSEILSPTPTHSYTHPGTYIVTLTVIDDDGSSDTTLTEVTVAGSPINQNPTAIPGGPYTGTVDKTIVLDGSASFDPDGTITNYTWNIGTDIAYGIAAPQKFSKTGTYTIQLTVTDDKGNQDTVSTTLNITQPEDTPGYEITILLISILVIFLFQKKNRRIT